MSATTPLAQVRPGDQLSGIYLLKTCLLRHTAQGSAFLLGEIQDRSGTLGFVLWNADEKLHAQLTAATTYTFIEGKADLHRERLQVVARTLAPRPDTAVDPAAFLPVSPRSDADMRAELIALVETVTDPHLRALLETLLIADGPIATAYARAPAAMTIHHAHIGGLLEHSLAVACLAEDLAARRPELDRDLLVVGALLHDLGKIEELSWKGAFTYTTRGNLIGHLAIAAELIADAIRAIDGFPPLLRDKVVHLILSHHGETAHGAVREPALREAIALHLLDNLDAKLEAFDRATAKATGSDPDWTEVAPMFGRRLYRGE